MGKSEIKPVIENLQDTLYQLENKQDKGTKLGGVWKNALKLSSKYLVYGIGAKLISNWEQNML